MKTCFSIINEKKEKIKKLEAEKKQIQTTMYTFCNLKISPLFKEIYQLQCDVNDLRIKDQQIKEAPNYYKAMKKNQLIKFGLTIPLAYIIPLLNNIIEFGVYNITINRFLEFFVGFIVLNTAFYFVNTVEKRNIIKQHRNDCLNLDKYESEIKNKFNELILLIKKRRELLEQFEQVNVISSKIERLKYDVLCFEVYERLNVSSEIKLSLDNDKTKSLTLPNIK